PLSLAEIEKYHRSVFNCQELAILVAHFPQKGFGSFIFSGRSNKRVFSGTSAQSICLFEKPLCIDPFLVGGCRCSWGLAPDFILARPSLIVGCLHDQVIIAR